MGVPVLINLDAATFKSLEAIAARHNAKMSHLIEAHLRASLAGKPARSKPAPLKRGAKRTLSPEVEDEVRARALAGTKARILADEYRVHLNTIYNICKRTNE